MKQTAPRAASTTIGVAVFGVCSAVFFGLLALTNSTKSNQGEAAVRRALATLTNLPVHAEFAKAPMPGWWEVRAGQDILYASDDGKYLIKGEVLSIADKRNLTQERQMELSRIDFDSLPLSAAIVRKIGSGKNKIAIFEDPNCGYCKQLERELSAQDDLTIYTILVPILSPDSLAKSRGIWCSKDRAQALDDWMSSKNLLPPEAPADCKDSTEEAVKFADAHGITGTPTLFFEDGSRLSGALSPEALKAAIIKASQATKKP